MNTERIKISKMFKILPKWAKLYDYSMFLYNVIVQLKQKISKMFWQGKLIDIHNNLDFGESRLCRLKQMH